MENNNMILSKYAELEFIKSETKDKVITDYYMKKPPKHRNCLRCNSAMHICSNHTVKLKEFPCLPDYKNFIVVHYSRFRCINCRFALNDTIPIKLENTFITIKFAAWIKTLVSYNFCIKDINRITGVHCNIIKKMALFNQD